uniref:Uncharacterized protein n=1 Tax=Astatotilapia calliptera TaxID=8154 RepID=A0A3P8PRC2_ASTCA
NSRLVSGQYPSKTAPLMFSIQNLCKTPVSRTQRSRIVSDGVKGEVFKVRLTDRSGVPFKTAFHMLWLYK